MSGLKGGNVVVLLNKRNLNYWGILVTFFVCLFLEKINIDQIGFRNRTKIDRTYERVLTGLLSRINTIETMVPYKFYSQTELPHRVKRAASLWSLQFQQKQRGNKRRDVG